MKSATLRTAANMAIFCLLALVLSAGQAVASSFPYYDDPQSSLQFVSSTTVANELISTWNIKNTGSDHDILFAVTAFQDVPNSDLSWNQGMGGWYGTVNGTILLVTVGLAGSLPWSKVAGPTGQNQESYTLFGETVGPPNAFPFFDLGVLPTGISVNIPVDFHFSWGDDRSGILGGYEYEVETVAPNPSSTPEPNTLLMLGSGVLGLAGIIRRKLTT